jgi:hypothetical protein
MGGETFHVRGLGSLGGTCPIPAECEDDFVRDFDRHHRSVGIAYSDFGHDYGFRMGAENQSCAFEDIEKLLKADFLRAHPNCDWDNMRRAIRYGWRRAMTMQA